MPVRCYRSNFIIRHGHYSLLTVYNFSMFRVGSGYAPSQTSCITIIKSVNIKHYYLQNHANIQKEVSTENWIYLQIWILTSQGIVR